MKKLAIAIGLLCCVATHGQGLTVEKSQYAFSYEDASAYYFTNAPTSPPNVFGWGSGSITNVPYYLTNAIMVSCGYDQCVALCSNGSVVAWGGDAYGQSDAPSDISNAVDVLAGQYWSAAVLADGTVRGWGSIPAGVDFVDATNVYEAAAAQGGVVFLDYYGNVNPEGTGIVTNGTPVTSAVAVAADGARWGAVKNDGSVVLVALGSYTKVACNATNGVGIAMAGNITELLRADGTAVKWTASSTNAGTVYSPVQEVAGYGASSFLLQTNFVFRVGGSLLQPTPDGPYSFIGLGNGFGMAVKQ